MLSVVKSAQLIHSFCDVDGTSIIPIVEIFITQLVDLLTARVDEIQSDL